MISNRLKSLSMIAAVGVAITLATATVGCNVDGEIADEEIADGETAEEPEARGAGEDVAEAEQEITACTQAFSHGGNLWSQTHTAILGCNCGAGYVRESYSVWNNGHGSCTAVGWASNDARDCRVKVLVQASGGWAWGQCNAQILKQASCFGYCGAYSPAGCYCDPVCSAYGDCCSDKSSYCP